MRRIFKTIVMCPSTCRDIQLDQRALKWTEKHLLTLVMGWGPGKNMLKFFTIRLKQSTESTHCSVHCCRVLSVSNAPWFNSTFTEFYRVPLQGLCVLQHLQFSEAWLLIRNLLQYKEARHLGAISHLLVGRSCGMLTILHFKSLQ